MLPGGIAQPFQGTVRRKQSGVNDGRQVASAIGAQPLTASTPWHDEGNSKPPPSNEGTDWQAERAGPKLEAGPKGSAERREGMMEARRGETRATRLDATHDSTTGHRPDGWGRPAFKVEVNSRLRDSHAFRAAWIELLFAKMGCNVRHRVIVKRPNFHKFRET